MSGQLQPASSGPSFVQQFMQFPRQSMPRTLLYSAVTNALFYQLASAFTRFVENRFHSTDKDKKAILGIVVFGGLTALFNVVQFKFFNFQLSRVATVALGVVVTATMTFTYFALNHRSLPFNRKAVEEQLKPEITARLERHSQLISDIGIGQETFTELMVVLSIPGEGEIPSELALLYLLRDRIQKRIRFSVPNDEDLIKYLTAQLRMKNLQSVDMREIQQNIDQILKDIENR